MRPPNQSEGQTPMSLLQSAPLFTPAQDEPPMPPEISITPQVIRQAKRGNRQAISAIYTTYVDLIYRYVLLRVENQMVAEDLTADVFARMVEGLPRYRMTGAPFEAWLYRIASARIIDHRRKQSRRQHSELPENMIAFGNDPENSVLQQQEASALQEALMQLNEQDRLVVLLRFVERKSHQEVADTIGKSVVAVRSIQHRALGKLASLMGMEQDS